MRHLGIVACAGLLLASFAACQVPPPSLTPLLAATEPVIVPTAALLATATSAAPSATPTTQLPNYPTAQPPIPSSTPTLAYGWRYWPNAVDFRAVATDLDGDLWLAALSGLVRYRPNLNQWTVWTTADGLIDNTGESVVVWRDVVWIGTQGGISCYDPQADVWRSYTGEQGLPGLYDIQLYLDEHADTLWAGTSGGLAHYEPESDRWQIERGEPVRHLWANADALWISVSPSTERRGGLFRLDKATKRWQDIHLLSDSPPPDAYALTGSDHTLWAVGMRGSVYEYDFSTATWREMSELYNRVDTLFQYPAYHDGQLWLFGNGRVVRVDVETGQIGRVPYPEQLYFYPQYPPVWIDQVAWVPAQSGLYALEGGQWIKHERLVPPSQIDRVIGVCGKRLFLNTPGGIIDLDLRTGSQSVLAIPDDVQLTDPTVACRQPEAQVWLFDTQEGMLARYEPWVQFSLSEHARPMRLLPHVDQDGRLWFVGADTLLSFDPQTRVWRTYLVPNAGQIDAAQQDVSRQNAPRSDVPRQDANAPSFIWLIKDGSALARFDAITSAFDVYPIPFGTHWRHLAVTGQTVWLGGESSRLLAFDIDQQRWQEVQLSQDCTGSAVNALAADEKAVWVGGEDGVVRLERDGRQTCFAITDGMLDDQVDQIALTDDGWVWFVNSWRGLWGHGPIEEETK